MRSTSTIRIGTSVFGILLLASACGGGGSGSETTDANDDVAIDATTSSSGAPSPPATTEDDEAGDGTDVDQDGVVAGDNCPFDFNPAQGDDDGDGVGNVCDDRTDITFDCGFGTATTSEIAVASGDDELNTVCYSITSGQPPPDWIELGTPILVTDDYLLIDFTDDQLAEARLRGLDPKVVETVAGRRPADLVELRLERDPAGALTTVDPDALAGVDPLLLAEVPADVLAAQPDRTLAAIPDEFWTEAPAATLDAVGRDRVVTINPQVRLSDLQIAPGAEIDLERSTITIAPTTRPPTTPAPAPTTIATTERTGDG